MNKSGFAIVTENGLYGLEDANGQKVVPCEYDKILDYDDDGYIRLLKGDVYSTISIKGKKAIPLSKGLTHLGVFWGGLARAKKGDRWGLVDVKGNAVTKFTFTQICAHKNNGYFAIDEDGVKGWLLDDGHFSPFDQQTSEGKKKPFREVRVFHDGVAPAQTWEGAWVFVDKQMNRVNNISYQGMDPVLRKGIYSTWKIEGSNWFYSAAYYDGKPIVEDWFDYPLHFKDGITICHKKELDENGKEIIIPNCGQPLCRYGILRSDGSWLFPMEYTDIHWNDYQEKDCWYAEDNKVCYLLYPDGSRKIYDKNRAVSVWGKLKYISKKNMDFDIPEQIVHNSYVPEVVLEKHLSKFNTEKFMMALQKYIGEWGDDLNVYYRDTDADFDIDDCYKEGQVIRAGDFMEATEKVLRPMHKVRFMIVATRLFSIDKYLHAQCNYKLPNPFPFKENIIHRNSYFVVVDVFRHLGKTQILLVKIPHGAYVLAKKYGFNFETLDYESHMQGLCLSDYARLDFEDKMTDPVHGHSIDDEWTEAMYQPIGLDRSMEPVSLEPDNESALFKCSYGRKYDVTFERFYDMCSDDYDYEWQEYMYITQLDNSIKVVVGDITRLRVDAIVNAANTKLLGGGGVDGAIHRAAGPELLEECEKLNGCKTGQSKITQAYDLPSRRIIHTVGPVWGGGKRNEDELLASCYRTALDLAEENNLKSIAFPCISTGVYRFPKERAARIAVGVVKDFLLEKKYTGDVIFCCFSSEDASVYKQILNELD